MKDILAPLRIPESLREELVALRSSQMPRESGDEVFSRNDVVILTLGFGPAIYLGLDGSVIIWHYMEDEPPRVTEEIKDAAPGLVIGANRHNLPQLLDLLPKMPMGSSICDQCQGARWMDLNVNRSVGNPVRVVCPDCYGLGWRTA